MEKEELEDMEHTPMIFKGCFYIIAIALMAFWWILFGV